MRRHVVLDTETTGLNVSEGHRIIEIGAVEVIDRRRTGEHFHAYLNPGRAVDEGALEVHGITDEFLADKPRFEDISDDFIAFVSGADLIIHNAPFDVGFLDQELARLPGPPRPIESLCTVTDSLQLARERHPGQRNSLDALCARYGVDNSGRNLHGALLDAEILADVYLAMTGGQVAMALELDSPGAQVVAHGREAARGRVAALPVVRASERELREHRRRLEAIQKASAGRCVWLALEG